MSTCTKTITVLILSLLAIGLAYVIWVQTKLLVLSIALLAGVVIIGYFVLRKA